MSTLGLWASAILCVFLLGFLLLILAEMRGNARREVDDHREAARRARRRELIAMRDYYEVLGRRSKSGTANNNLPGPTAVPQDLRFVGFGDEDEGWGTTLEELVKCHYDGSLVQPADGDYIVVDEFWMRKRLFRLRIMPITNRMFFTAEDTDSVLPPLIPVVNPSEITSVWKDEILPNTGCGASPMEGEVYVESPPIPCLCCGMIGECKAGCPGRLP